MILLNVAMAIGAVRWSAKKFKLEDIEIGRGREGMMK
jgi:hypothetical protein